MYGVIRIRKASNMAVPGLKALRKQRGTKPTFYCDNCKCHRYSPCTCQKPAKSAKKGLTPCPTAK